MSRTWRDSLRNSLADLTPSESALRFDLLRVPISTIAQQFYCEMKVDNEYRFGQVPTPEKDEGTQIHEEVLAMEPTTPEKLVESISRRPRCLCTFPVYGKVGNLNIVGIPDAVLFKKSRPLHLIELKTTRSGVDTIWRDQAVQIKTYANALESMGFDCDDLRLSLIRINKSDIGEARESLLGGIADALLNDDVTKAEQFLRETLGVPARVHVLRYNREEALKDILWASDYWLMKREAIPTNNPAKCRACEFKEVCSFSLAK